MFVQCFYDLGKRYMKLTLGLSLFDSIFLSASIEDSLVILPF